MNTSMLDALNAHAEAAGWNTGWLDGFRMEAEGDGSGDAGTSEGESTSEGSSEGEGSGSESSESSEGEGASSGGEGQNGRRSLEDILSALGDNERQAILGEVSKARREAKGLRDRLKGAETKASEYDKLVEASKTEQERAVEAAKGEGRKAALAEVGESIARAKIEAALTGLVPDPESFVDDLNLSRYVGEDGKVDSDAVNTLREKYAALAPTKGTPGVKPNPAQGTSGGSEAPQGQITSVDQLRGLSNDEINRLRKEGRLDRLMGKKAR